MKSIQLRADIELHEKVKALADHLGVSVSALTRMLWARAIEDPSIIIPKPQKEDVPLSEI